MIVFIVFGNSLLLYLQIIFLSNVIYNDKNTDKDNDKKPIS